jgi:general secretion pathway protein L
MQGMTGSIQQLHNLMASAQAWAGNFFRWWFTELREIVPDPIARKLGVNGECTLAHLGFDKVTLQHWDAVDALTVRTADLEQQGGNIIAAPLAGTPVFIDIGIENTLTGQLTAPFAAELRLNQAVLFEIERLCPFRIADALFDYTVTERDRTNKTLTVEWVVVPRALVEKSCRAIASLGLRPSAIGVAGDQPRKPRYTFERYREVNPWRLEKPAAALIAACLFLALAAGYTIHASEVSARQITAQVEATKAKAERTKALRTQTEAVASAVARLADRTHAPSPAAMLSEITALLPPDTWVQRFSLNGGELRLIGVSAAASPLIERLAALPFLKNPRFQAPITAQASISTERDWRIFTSRPRSRRRARREHGNDPKAPPAPAAHPGRGHPCGTRARAGNGDRARRRSLAPSLVGQGPRPAAAASS